MSKLTLDFSENNLKETNSYQMLLTKKESLAGLPEIIVEAAAETAQKRRERRLGLHPATPQVMFHL